MQLPFEDEKEIIEKAKSDPEIFGKLFEKYYDQIYRFILHRTANVAAAEELTSNTFFKALNNLWNFKWSEVPFSAWLYRIATNEANIYFRKNKRIDLKDFSEDAGFENGSSASYDEHKILEAELSEKRIFLNLQKAIETLKPKYQEVIVLKYFEEKSIKEISEILNKSEGTIKSLIHRAVNMLKEKIDPSLYDEYKNE